MTTLLHSDLLHPFHVDRRILGGNEVEIDLVPGLGGTLHEIELARMAEHGLEREFTSFPQEYIVKELRN